MLFMGTIRIARNAEMEQQFVYTASRMTWNMNKRRWMPPFFDETYERLRCQLTLAFAPGEGFYQGLAKYGEQLKSTWS